MVKWIERIEFIESEKLSARVKAARTKTTNTSISCQISDDQDTLRQQRQRGIEHVGVLLGHLKLEWLLHRFPPRLVWALYVLINGFITIALLAVLALFTKSPFVFPSLGPTAYLLFFSPLAQTSSPRNTILGHAIGLICGYAAFSLTGASLLPFGFHARSTGQESSLPLFLSRLRVLSWCCCEPVIRRRGQPL